MQTEPIPRRERMFDFCVPLSDDSQDFVSFFVYLPIFALRNVQFSELWHCNKLRVLGTRYNGGDEIRIQFIGLR